MTSFEAPFVTDVDERTFHEVTKLIASSLIVSEDEPKDSGVHTVSGNYEKFQVRRVNDKKVQFMGIVSFCTKPDGHSPLLRCYIVGVCYYDEGCWDFRSPSDFTITSLEEDLRQTCSSQALRSNTKPE